MSLQSAIAKLRSPVRNLVSSVTRDGQELGGQTESDQKEVLDWIEKTSQGVFLNENSLKHLDSLLTPKTYIATNYVTAADVALYGELHPLVAKLSAPEYYAVPSLTRYFDHIQSRPFIRTTAENFGDTFRELFFDLEGAPRLERKVELSKKKEKVSKAQAPADKEAKAASETTTESLAAPPSEKYQKKEKKVKKSEAEPKAGSSQDARGAKLPAADEGEPIPSMIDLRVGHIVDVIKHPDADGLYIEQIDLGEETGPRTVVSGLVNYIPIEEMRDKYLIAVCNLKPANMRGVKSFAMVLCATSKDGKEGGIELIQPPANSKPGDRVYFEGEEFINAAPLAQLNPKKKIFETIQPGFITLDSREAAWINPVTKSVHKIRTDKGVCVAPSLVGASLS